MLPLVQQQKINDYGLHFVFYVIALYVKIIWLAVKKPWSSSSSVSNRVKYITVKSKM
jgi:hypothetical protein